MWILILPGLLAALFLALGIALPYRARRLLHCRLEYISEEQRKKYYRTKLLRSMAVFSFFYRGLAFGVGCDAGLAVQGDSGRSCS